MPCSRRGPNTAARIQLEHILEVVALGDALDVVADIIDLDRGALPRLDVQAAEREQHVAGVEILRDALAITLEAQAGEQDAAAARRIGDLDARLPSSQFIGFAVAADAEHELEVIPGERARIRAGRIHLHGADLELRRRHACEASGRCLRTEAGRHEFEGHEQPGCEPTRRPAVVDHMQVGHALAEVIEALVDARMRDAAQQPRPDEHEPEHR
jgi:hypothetical protein